MTLPDYQVFVINASTGQTVKYFDQTTWYMLRYSRMLNDVGRIVLTVSATDELDSVFLLDNFIEVQRTNPITGRIEKEETYLIRTTNRYVTDNEERYTVGGMSLNHLLQRRVVDPADDPLAAGGYSTKSGLADLIMREYAREQAADLASSDRAFPNLTVPPVEAIGLSAGARLRYERLFDVLLDLGLRGNIDFQIARTTGNSMELLLSQFGTDKTFTPNYSIGAYVRLSGSRGNLVNPSLEIDRQDEANHLYLQGPGQGEDRIIYQQSDDSVSDSPFNRIEFVADARNVEKGDLLALQSAADAELKKRRKKIKFDFQPVVGSAGSIYRQDWDIADYITAAWGDFSEDLRIIGVEIAVDSSGETFNLTTEPKDLL